MRPQTDIVFAQAYAMEALCLRGLQVYKTFGLDEVRKTKQTNTIEHLLLYSNKKLLYSNKM